MLQSYIERGPQRSKQRREIAHFIRSYGSLSANNCMRIIRQSKIFLVYNTHFMGNYMPFLETFK